MGLLKRWERPGGLCTLALSPSVSTPAGLYLYFLVMKSITVQSYQVKHTSHLCITYSQVETLQTSLRPQVVGCCVQKARSPFYIYVPS